MTTYTQGVPPLDDAAPDTVTFLRLQLYQLAAVPGFAGVFPVKTVQLSVKKWNGTTWVKQ